MGRSEKTTDNVEKLSQRTSILRNGEKNGLKDFSNSCLLPNEMLLCDYPKGVSMWTLATTAMDISFLRFFKIHTSWKKYAAY